MSKNFELLHNISNEKDLFQTLDAWEGVDAASVNAEREAEFEGQSPARPQHPNPLPDVFQRVNDTLGPLDLVPPDLSRNAERAQELIKEPVEKEKTCLETQINNFVARFPISRNAITRLNSALDIPKAWVKSETGLGRNDELELELETETLPRIEIPGSAPTPEKAANSSEAKVQESSPAKEEKAHHPAHHEPAHSQPSRSVGVGDSKSVGESRAKKARVRSAYRDSRREAIAREEELKLVQRVFLAEESSPRMVLFSGFEGDTGCASLSIRAGEILASQAEGSVCLVDMGFRVPSLHEYCGVSNDRGLAEAIADSNPIQEFAKQLSPANLWVIPGGQGASQMNFAKVADRLRARMEELRNTFRFVVVHSGSLWLNADAMLISKWTDGVVLILEANSTRRDTARRIKESLAAANARVLGVVLNNRAYPIPETLYSRL